jgi:hypothetical protein
MGNAGESHHPTKERIGPQIVDVLKAFCSNEHHDKQNKKNISDVVIALETVCFKALLESTVDTIYPQIVINKCQPREGRHILTNKTNRKYFVFSCNQSAFFISHLSSLSEFGFFCLAILSIPLFEKLFQLLSK